jgi:hypothetical protein
MLAHAYASSSCIEACSPTSEFHVRSFTAPVSAATTTSAAIYQPIPTPYGVSSPRQADRLPRVIRVTFTAYIRRIYVPTFRMVSGFECCGPLAQMRPPLSAGCSSDRSFAYSFLQIPPRGGHPCCSASPHFSQTCPSRSFFVRPLQLITSHERRLETCILRKVPGAGLNSSRAANAFRPSISLKAEG